jgi:hypothetical protein
MQSTMYVIEHITKQMLIHPERKKKQIWIPSTFNQ